MYFQDLHTGLNECRHFEVKKDAISFACFLLDTGDWILASVTFCGFVVAVRFLVSAVSQLP